MIDMRSYRAYFLSESDQSERCPPSRQPMTYRHAWKLMSDWVNRNTPRSRFMMDGGWSGARSGSSKLRDR